MEPEQYALMARVERDHWWYVGMRRLVAVLLADAAPEDSTWRVLDAGCGTGGTTAWLRRYGSVVGVDLAAEAAPFWPARGLQAATRGPLRARSRPQAGGRRGGQRRSPTDEPGAGLVSRKARGKRNSRPGRAPRPVPAALVAAAPRGATVDTTHAAPKAAPRPGD